MAKTPSTSPLSLVMVTDINGDGLPNYGDTITFKVATAVEYPTVELRCYQDGHLVASAGAGFYDSYPWPWARNMTLASATWTGGAADCVATLVGSGHTKPLATLKFTVNP